MRSGSWLNECALQWVADLAVRAAAVRVEDLVAPVVAALEVEAERWMTNLILVKAADSVEVKVALVGRAVLVDLLQWVILSKVRS